MKATLTRVDSGDQGTFGLLVLENGAHWHSLELPWRENRTKISCIPEGLYAARLEWSEHFQRNVYHLQDVPDRQAVEIHPANFAGDVMLGWSADLLGCIALGTGTGQLVNRSGISQRALIASRTAMTEFESALNGEELEIEIKSAEKVA